VSLADVASGKEIWKATQRGQCRGPAFVPGRPWVVVWRQQGFEIWDRKTGAPIKGSHALFATWPDEGLFVPAAEGQRLVGWGYRAQAPKDDAWVLDLRVRELPGLRERARFGPELVRGHDLKRVIPAPQGSLALLTATPNIRSESDDQRELRIWDTASGQVLHEFGALHESGARVEGWGTGAAAWSPDGRRLLLDRFEIEGHELRRSYLALWDAVHGKLVRSFADRPPVRVILGPPALFLAFSEDGAQATSVDWDRSFRRWEVATGKELASVKWEDSAILALSRDGTLAISDRRNVWDTTTGKVLQTLEETPWERPPPWESGAEQPNRSVIVP
jgi:WD40 repeat protein